MIPHGAQLDEDFFSATLYGPRLVLNPYSEDRDLDHIAAMLSDPLVTGPMGIPHPALSVEELRRAKQLRAQRPDTGDWSVYLPYKEGDLFTGEVGITDWNPEPQVAEIFIAISSEHFGKAYGREALSCLLEHIFRASRLACARVQVLVGNSKALALAADLGFRETGRRFVPHDPHHGFIGGTAAVLDCRTHHFKPFVLEEKTESD